MKTAPTRERRWYWQIVKLTDESGGFEIVTSGHEDDEATTKRVAAQRLRFCGERADMAEAWPAVRFEVEPGLFIWEADADDLVGTRTATVNLAGRLEWSA